MKNLLLASLTPLLLAAATAAASRTTASAAWLAAAGGAQIAGSPVEAEKATRGTTEVEPRTNPIDRDLVERLGPDAELVIAGNRPADFRGPGPDPTSRLTLVPVAGEDFVQAARVSVGEATDPIWDAQLTSPPSTAAVKKGDVLFGSLDLRAVSEKESGGGQFVGWLQNGGSDWHGFRKLEGAPGAAWQRRHFALKADADAAAGEMDFVFQLGMIPQAFEVANVLLWNLGPDAELDRLPKTRLTYEGQAPDAPWRAEARRRIDAHRKADLRVAVVDAAGEPVRGARVRVAMDRLGFGIGTFLSDRHVAADDATAQRYKRTVLAHFNRVTAPSYGAQAWGWPDPASRERYLATLAWASEQDLTLKAHPIVWSRFDWMPRSFSEARDDPSALRAEIERYITEVATILAEHRVEEVDALNEPVLFHEFDDVIRAPGLRAAWFEAAHDAAPRMRLLINEHGVLSAGGRNRIKQDKYAAIIEDLLGRGVPLGGIGFQGHIGEDFTPPEKLWEVLDRFAAFGLPLHVTEFDINTEDEDTQADYLRDFVTAVYAHPAVESVTFWGFWGGAMWIPNAQLWREDWTMKPGAEALVELTGETLRTDERVVTGADGTATVRGHLGAYTASAGGVSQRVELGGGGATVTLRLP
ncbi:endo-1,4-beta-xylanase [Phycisphaera mikurensis]|uniref:endo-1,4-beta-xylanase n=1 Tax=Phycisphaera mikurensis (strain NBRC 102666 / KCTC 22515 / FYK2301M01) TaxID=1142394 RepID=I0IHY9_PHYMF|nr:endo-1,4-beta-xylanase [Phycisphaera mikurensis]MBB6441115.1 GH35 family endo-1,4-beta-xylanase [Phycisphaera mikurensis]BAM04877.1 putative glycoside hydrolase [Phycisphaera mikurensis NBRC 102666]